MRVETTLLDVASDDSVSKGIHEVLDKTGGRLDVVVNNAGYYALGPLEETTPDELRAQLETNVIGVHRVTRAVLPAMRAQGSGRIIVLGSISGRVAVPMVGPTSFSGGRLRAFVPDRLYEWIMRLGFPIRRLPPPSSDGS